MHNLSKDTSKNFKGGYNLTFRTRENTVDRQKNGG